VFVVTANGLAVAKSFFNFVVPTICNSEFCVLPTLEKLRTV
jgi:hypothetical protein